MLTKSGQLRFGVLSAPGLPALSGDEGCRVQALLASSRHIGSTRNLLFL